MKLQTIRLIQFAWKCSYGQLSSSIELNFYSFMNMRQLHILFNSAKTWHVIVCWFLCFPPNLPELNLKLFCSDVQNNFRFSSGKFGGKHRNQQTITCQVLAELNKIWSCLIFIKLYRFQLLLDSREFPQIDFQQVPFLICYTSSKMHLLTDCHQHRIFGIFDKKSR